MSLPKLVLLTEHFPFGHGEAFLETEVPYLARCFEVEIVPTAVYAAELSTRRPVPGNVCVREDLARVVMYSPARWMQRFAKAPSNFLDLARLLRQEFGRVPRHFWTIRRFIRVAIQALLVDDVLQQDLSLQQADIYYSYWLTSGALALALRKEAGQTAVFVSRAHRGDLYIQPGLGMYQPYQQRIIPSLDQIICISEHGYRYLSQRYSACGDKFRVCRLGVQPAPQCSKPSTDGRLHLVSCAHLRPVKRIDLLLNALAQCTTPITWTHFGGGSLESALISQAHQLPPNVSWRFTGRVPNEKILDFYRSEPVDLFVNVSTSEGLPVSIMEAMSYGIPVAATDVGGTSELVNSSNGFLLPADIRAGSLATFLTQFYKLPPANKQRLRERAWQTWSEKVNAERQYTNFSDYLRGLLEHNAD